MPVKGGDDVEEMVASQDQHDDGFLRPPRLRFVDDLDNPFGFGLGFLL